MLDANSLLSKKCVPCEGGVDPLVGEKLQYYAQIVPEWTVVDGVKIERDFIFKNFKEAMVFVNNVADLAESEGHHPDMHLHNWKNVKVTLMTHAIKGLSDNDFILAAKINNAYSDMKSD